MATNVVSGATVAGVEAVGAAVAGVVSLGAEPLLGNVVAGKVVVGKIAEFFWNKVVDTPDGSPLVEPEPPQAARKKRNPATNVPLTNCEERMESLCLRRKSNRTALPRYRQVT